MRAPVLYMFGLIVIPIWDTSGVSASKCASSVFCVYSVYLYIEIFNMRIMVIGQMETDDVSAKKQK